MTPRTRLRLAASALIGFGAFSELTAQGAPPVTLSAISTLTAAAPGGKNPVARITLSGPAPSGGYPVQLSSNGGTTASVPAAVTVLAGATTADVVVTTQPVAQSVPVTITASANGIIKTAVFTVQSPTLSAVTFPPDDGSLSITGQVSLNGLAPSGGVLVALATAGPLPSVTIPAGKTSAEFTLNLSPVATATPLTIVASLGGSSRSGTLIRVPPVPKAVLFVFGGDAPGIPSVSAIAGNSFHYSGQVDLAGPVASGHLLDVSLSSSNPNLVVVAPTVSLPSGSTHALFGISVLPVSQPTPVTVTETAGGVSKQATITLLPPNVAALTLRSNTVAGGQAATMSILLDGPAPPPGTPVAMSSSNPGVAPVPASVTVPVGATTMDISIATSAVAQPTTVSILAHSTNVVTRSASLSVAPRTLASIVLSASSIAGGDATTGHLTLTGPATPPGMPIQLSSSNPSLVSVPSSLIIPGDSTAKAFQVSSGAVTQATSVNITATAGGVSKVVALSLVPSRLGSISVPDTVIASRGGTGRVTLTIPAPVGGTVVSLTSSSPAAVSVPPSVTVPQGSTSEPFPIGTQGAIIGATATITARIGTVSKAAHTVVRP